MMKTNASIRPDQDRITYSSSSAAHKRRSDKFQFRVAVCASGGKFVDGWILAVIGIALPLASMQMGMSPLWEGLIGASSLIGIFVGGLLFGWLTDLVGRRRMFTLTLTIFLIFSVLQFFVTDPGWLFVFRLVMGIAVGADYAIAGALIAEFSSRKKRGPYLAGMLVWWYAGFAVSAIGALLALAYWGESDLLWRIMLVSSGLPALIMLFIRIGLPESPRWLMSKGRVQEAETIATQYLSDEVKQDIYKEDPDAGGFKELFSRQGRRKTVFTSLFWMAQVTPFFALYTFLPRVLESLNLNMDASWGEILMYLVLLIGSAIGALLVNRVGRRNMLIVPFAVTGIALLVLGLWPGAPAPLVVLCFLTFALFNSGSNVLQMLYPSEIFPTGVRATGVGFAAAMSRIGSAVGTFLLPIILVHWGITPVMLISAAILFGGMIISMWLAPETTGKDLSDSTRSLPVITKS